MFAFIRQKRGLIPLLAGLAAIAVWVAGCSDESLGEAMSPAGDVNNASCTSAGSCKKVTINGKEWMAENLNIAAGNSWCYSDKNSNCDKYGRLYDWKTARTVCPSGWRLPSRTEWADLAKDAGGTGTYGDGGTAGNGLKATSGWPDYNITINGATHGPFSGNGDDMYGFSALPGGYRNSNGGFIDAGGFGYWWTGTEEDTVHAYNRYMGYGNDNLGENDGNKSSGFSVRCLRDFQVY
jgi:uncharacterized protein (TIGR02145 family)